MAGIFISYRQADTKAWAIGLQEDLTKAFGDDQVFLDKDALGPGNWRDQLQRALDQCSVVLVLIGKQWLTLTDEHNRPKISLPEDVHRNEIRLALRHAGVTVIPVLVDDVSMPTAEQLPEDIRGLTNQQARKIGDTKGRRKVDLEVLIKDIEMVSGLIAPKPVTDIKEGGIAADPSPWYKPDVQVAMIAGVLTVLVGVATYGSGGLSAGEMSGWLVVFYVLVLMGKLVRRHYCARRRRVA